MGAGKDSTLVAQADPPGSTRWPAAHRRVHDELAGLAQVLRQQRALHVAAQRVLQGRGASGVSAIVSILGYSRTQVSVSGKLSLTKVYLKYTEG